MLELLESASRRGGDVVRYLAEATSLLFRTVLLTVTMRGHGLRVIRPIVVMQLLFTGTQAVLPVTIASIAVGTLVVSQATEYLPADYVVGVASIILVREVLPILTAFLVIGRSGTAITIEVGSMKLNDELRALRMMGIPFEHFVLLPRLIGMIISFVLLMAYAYVAALAGGYYVWFAISAAPASFPVVDLLEGVGYVDLLLSMLKVTLFGIVVAVTSVQHGLMVQHSRRELPIQTSRSLVRSTLLCAIINTVVSLLA